MKIEIEVEEIETPNSIEEGGIIYKTYLIQPERKSYETNMGIGYSITPVEINFDITGEDEERNKIEAKSLVDLILDISHLGDIDDNKIKQDCFDWVREALREKLGIGKEEIKV